MNRDMDFIRELLLDIEANDTVSALALKKADDRRLAYHLLQMQEAGFIAGIVVAECLGGELIIQVTALPRLTWAGHEFLDAARSETIWTEAKKKVGGGLGTVSFTVLTQLLIQLAQQHLGIP